MSRFVSESIPNHRRGISPKENVKRALYREDAQYRYTLTLVTCILVPQSSMSEIPLKADANLLPDPITSERTGI